MKADQSIKKASKLKKTYPVPEWMDSELKPIAEKLDILGRHELASKLEKQAEQLREFKLPVIPATPAQTDLRPNVKRSVIEFANLFGGKDKTEEAKISMGIRWILEVVLTDFSQLVARTAKHGRYRDAEDLDDSNYSEKLVGDSLEKWLQQRIETP